MPHIVFSKVFNTKIINGECELHWPCGVLPWARCVGHFVVSCWAQALAEELVREYASLWEAIDGFADFEVDESIFDMIHQFILIIGCLWENIDWHFHVFKTVHGRSEKKIFDVKA